VDVYLNSDSKPVKILLVEDDDGDASEAIKRGAMDYIPKKDITRGSLLQVIPFSF
jgi:DNA-binding NarL/FixJ family response regulator